MDPEFIPHFTAIVINLIFFTFLILFIIFERKARMNDRECTHKERLAMIEKGQYDFPQHMKKGINLPRYMAWGFIFSGIGLAIILGLAIMGEWDGMIGGLIPLFIGIGLLLFNKIQSEKDEQKERNQ
ncbi:DUF6249 domain-containing protein [candidate division KSB1 bacterium]